MIDPYLDREYQRFAEELILVNQYPPEDLASIITEVGFLCNSCGGCCIAGQNGHVFLLDQDTDRAQIICPDALIPAPFFEACDKEGNFYVSGYALRTNADGSCIHLSDKKCKIYQDRFSICRIYPYMLHREPDEKGHLVFRQISGLNEHGEYHALISSEESDRIARETIEYERAWLIQMIQFFDELRDLFAKNQQRHVRKIYDNSMKEFKKGKPVKVFVFHNRQFTPVMVSIQDYEGILK
jgi:Fe-S-cluster containining protein